jgi:hypothetical protein
MRQEMGQGWQDGHRWRSAAYWREVHELYARDRQMRDALLDLYQLREEQLAFARAVEAREARRRLLKYNPAQPRVPAGEPDGGQWTSGLSGGQRIHNQNSRSRSQALAEIISICIISGKAVITDKYGNSSFSATYECPDGSTIQRQGFGKKIPGLIRYNFWS